MDKTSEETFSKCVNINAVFLCSTTPLRFSSLQIKSSPWGFIHFLWLRLFSVFLTRVLLKAFTWLQSVKAVFSPALWTAPPSRTHLSAGLTRWPQTETALTHRNPTLTTRPEALWVESQLDWDLSMLQNSWRWCDEEITGVLWNHL